MDPWVFLANELNPVAARIWERSKGRVGQSFDPTMIATKLYGRAWSNYRAFCLLRNKHFIIEAQVVLRSCVEATICLANLNVRGQAFVDDLRSDAAATLKGAQKILRTLGAEADAQAIQDASRSVFGDRREDGQRHGPLSMEVLAEGAGAPHLYRTYRRISGLAAHVTGASIAGYQLENEEGPRSQERYRQAQQRDRHIALVDALATMIQAMINHTAVVGDDDGLAAAVALSTAYQAISARHLEELLDEGSV